MKNFFKSIWNFFFKYENDSRELTTITFKRNAQMGQLELKDTTKREIVTRPKINTQLFRKHQLTDKIFNIGKHRYRIKQKIGFTESEKLRYQITQL